MPGDLSEYPARNGGFFLFKLDFDPFGGDDDALDEEVEAGIDFGGGRCFQPGGEVGNGLEFAEGGQLLLTGEGFLPGLPGFETDGCDTGIDLLFAFGVAGEIPLPGEVGIFETGELGFERFDLVVDGGQWVVGGRGRVVGGGQAGEFGGDLLEKDDVGDIDMAAGGAVG